jgi:hypothetical protein
MVRFLGGAVVKSSYIASAEGSDEILRHIQECDRMYSSIYGNSQERPSPCKKLMKMGFPLTYDTLPDLCIQHCERWRLREDEKMPHGRPPVVLPDFGGLGGR